MSDFEANGSFHREPAISEKELAQRLHELANFITPDKCENIERKFSLKLETPFENRELYRSKEEISAALRHEVGDEVTIQFRFDPAWSTVQPSHLEFALPGTEEVKGYIDYDSNCGFESGLKDTDGTILPRDAVAVETVENLLASLGVSSRIDFFQEGLRAWLQQGAGKEMYQHILQRYVIYEGDVDEEITGTCEIEKEQIMSPDEVTTYIHFIETILTDDKRFARILTLFESDRGSGLSLKEITQDEDSGDTQEKQCRLDYELIEKLLQRLRKAEVLATR